MYQIAVFVHLICAMIWVGGMLFLALVVVPATRGMPPADRGALLTALGRRFRVVGWVVVFILIVTGIWVTHERGVTVHSITSGALFKSEFGKVLAAKVLVVGVMLAITLVHDLVVGPAMTRALSQSDAASAQEAVVLRKRTAMLARTSALLAVIVVALAVALVRGLPWG